MKKPPTCSAAATGSSESSGISGGSSSSTGSTSASGSGSSSGDGVESGRVGVKVGPGSVPVQPVKSPSTNNELAPLRSHLLSTSLFPTARKLARKERQFRGIYKDRSEERRAGKECRE